MTVETTLLEQAFVVEEGEVPTAPVAALAGAGAGNVDTGTHSYKATFTNTAGESLPSLVSNTVTTTSGSDGKVNVTMPTLVTGATGWKLYRTAAGNAVTGPWLLVAAIASGGGAPYLDNIADGSLTTAVPTENTASDGSFGFGVLVTDPVATDAFRHHELTLDKKNNREPSPAKRGTPDRTDTLPRITETTWELGAAFWEPSGTLGTKSYLTKFLRNGIGSRTVPALSTTVASGGATTGAVLTSAGTLAPGDTVVVTLATRREITRIKTVATNTVTWDPISAAPANGAAVVSGVNYVLTSLHPTSLQIFKFHTAGGFKENVSGAIVNQMAFTFDGSREVGITMGGPGRNRVRTGFNQPAAHTTVGTPASGLVGNVMIDGAAFLVLSAEVRVENNSMLRKGEIGTAGLGTGIMSHTDFRNVTISLSFYLEDTNLLTKAEAVTRCVVRLLIGDTNGLMVGAVLPNVEFEIPSIPATGGPKVVTIEGVAMAATAGNDSLFLGEH